MNDVRILSIAGRRGMVLLEVAIALTIFAVISLGLVMALDQGFGAAEDRNQADRAESGLRNQLALLHGAPLVPGSRDLASDSKGLSYRLDVEPISMLDQRKQPLLGLYRATVTVQWKDGKRDDFRSISQLVYQP